MLGLRFILCEMFLFCFAISLNSFAAILSSIKSHQDSIDFEFSTKGSVKSKYFIGENPHRVVVDFSNTEYSHNDMITNPNSPSIKKIKVTKLKNATLRLVIELKQKVAPNFVALAYAPYKLRLNLLSKVKQRSLNSPSANKAARPVVIVIDAGHGGKDPGAHGPHLTKEKNIVLEIARKLKAQIDKEKGMRAVLTRQSDYYISLRKRLDIARKNNADLFISIHADAFKQPNSSGVSVYALSQSGATSEAAHWLAEKENYSELGDINLNSLNDKNGLVREVLIDLSQTATIGASLHIGEQVLKALDLVTDLHYPRVEQARFVVLKSPDIPSILIETGFISNPSEEKNLASLAYQTKLSMAIFKGIKQYFIDYPPNSVKQKV
ncbi:MAG: hypothetical protein A3F18_05500 [Legionellales bacterium RIFCSPHIGHO2_12_FULL_37_14]|nr:MAG: hypothetical protein A3F18_05500 [Legionellales bacterium RIFCSPHIGHO2_12_FULL_37_14]